MADTKQDRDEAQRLVIAAIAQHTSYLHRASTATANRIKEIIDESGKALASELLDRLDNLTQGERAALQRYRVGAKIERLPTRVQGVVKFIEQWADELDSQIRDRFTADGKELAGEEVRYTEDLMSQVLVESATVSITAQQAYAKAMQEPLLGQFVEDMLAEVAAGTKKRVYNRIREGVANGETNAEIVRALRGTKALNFKNGILQTTRTEAERVVRTGRQHISTTAYEETYRALDVRELVWVASLELRTCKRCAPLDGKRFKIDDPHPRPALHPNCRCSIAPSFDGEVMGKRPYVRAMKVKGRDGDAKYRSIGNMTEKQRKEAGLEVGQVSASTTFNDWFSRQPAKYQREWLGDKRYALYSKGDYTLDRFTDPQNREYTLEELAARDRETFEQLFSEA
ncbi:minor capsid protein [Halomonas sp. McH1-25]|uniref:minor capsid protein n=1 Tax=unclassified Halomonas TaxID=2609666 RepID=UPI001EF47CAF|nr:MULTISPECIES: minor capsid protein [unclassified Halomonas]MCG7598872.1 minor capsid protein [Halomonas sp. McH1-25]MCP1340835.1 minor capsid protein [Halomonas sp. FL8]MCP1361282.1 minor capsid protein [Halomonas sp. BBD45]MCP1363691.1 minor capsid protein [Halomonas sp. BBD48]